MTNESIGARSSRAASPTQTIVSGYLADNWSDANNAIIVNRVADPIDVLAWCWGEVQSLLTTAHHLDQAAEISGADLGAIFTHRLQMVAPAMEQAISKIKDARRALSEPADSSGRRSN